MKSFKQLYHLSPPYGFMNDPNGLSTFKDYFHVFYQWNNAFPRGKSVHWGHFASKDLVYWKHYNPVLAPEHWYDKDGCYSGSAIEYENELIAFYTGNVKNEQGKREAYQCLAISKDGFSFQKHRDNPLIEQFPKGYTAHFRDPKIWIHDNIWYMVIGAQRDNQTGTVVLYKSPNPFDWELVGEISEVELGYMWECPDLFSLGEKMVLVFCPQGLEPQGDEYQNRYQCGYMLGEFDYGEGRFSGKDFIELDRGFEFYAPQTLLLSDGRRVLWAWMGMPEEDDQPTVQREDWIHCMTLPRELYLKENKVYQWPIKELKALREKEVKIEGFMVDNELKLIDQFAGINTEIDLEITNIDSQEFGFYLRCSTNADEFTKLSFYNDTQKVKLDRSKSGQWAKGERQVPIKTNAVKIRVFSDSSSLEIFLNGGEESFTARIFPKDNSINFAVYSRGGQIVVTKARKWSIKEAVEY